MVRYKRAVPGLASLLVLALAAPVALTFGAPPGDTSSADDSYEETLALVGKIEAHNTARRYAEAAWLAAEGAARSDLADYERVLLGGLARQNFELSYKKGGDVGDLCKLGAVMRLVAPLDSNEGGAHKLAVASEAEAALERARGPGWRAVCEPAAVEADPIESKSVGLITTKSEVTGGAPEEMRAGQGAGSSDETPGEKTSSAPLTADSAGSPTHFRGPLKQPTVRPAWSLSVTQAKRRFRAGIGILVPGALLFTPMALLVVSHYNGRKEMARINAATKEHPATEVETARAATLADRHTATTAGAVALGVTGAALTVAGWVLVLTSAPPARVAVTPWGGRGIGGLVLEGRF